MQFSTWQIQHKDRLENRPVIYQFVGDNRPFSNFWPCNIILPADDILPAMAFDCVEKAYMAWKTNEQSIRNDIRRMTPGQAKRHSYTPDFKHRDDYNDAGRLKIMHELVGQKFSRQNPDLLSMLLETKDALIIEGNVHCDAFFGFNLEEGYGLNHLGRTIMDVRCTRQQELSLLHA